MRTTSSTEDRTSDWLLVTMTASLVLPIHVAFAISSLVKLAPDPVDLRLRATLVVLSASVLAALLATRRTKATAPCAAAFVSLLLPYLATTWISETHHAAAGRLGQPCELFLGSKVAVFVIAALCPARPRWLALALLVAFVGQQIALWHALDLSSPEAHVNAYEPGTTAAVDLIALLLLGFRAHHSRHERELGAAHAEASVLRTANDAFLAVKDLANTPLQSLEVALALMAAQRPEDVLVIRARRALAQLRRLVALLPVTNAEAPTVDAHALDRIRAGHPTTSE